MSRTKGKKKAKHMMLAIDEEDLEEENADDKRRRTNTKITIRIKQSEQTRIRTNQSPNYLRL